MAGEAREDALEREHARTRGVEERAAGQEREARARTAELVAANAAMARTTARLGRAGDLRSFLDQVSLEIAATTRADSVGLALIEDGHLRSPTASLVLNGRLVPPDPLAPTVPVGEAPFLEILASERRPRSFDLEREAHLFWPGALALHRAEGHRRVVSTALWVGDEVVGILAVAFRREDPLDDSQLAMLQALATQAALAVRLTRLSEEALLASVAREHEKLTRAQVDVLQAANDALRRGTERVGQHGGLEALLGAFLLEAMQVSGASGGGITEWRDRRFSKHLAIAQDGVLVPFEDWRHEPMIQETAEVFGRDDGGFATALLSQPILRITLADARTWWPSAAEYHARRGHVEVWNVPCALRGRLLAHLGLAFRRPREMDAITVSTLTSLAQQMTLALELTYLGDAAKQAAIEMETARAVATERNRMAGEIHDSLAQAFTSIALQTEALLSEVGEESPLRESLAVVEETARIGLAEARSSVLALRPVGDKPGDLELALESLANRCTIPGSLSCSFRRGPASFPPSPDARDAALRVAQEAVANALRHAKATRVDIYYEVVDGWAQLCIRDDGVGIGSPSLPKRGGLGVPGMRARAAALGGTLTVETPSDGVGTEVRLSIPVDRTAEARFEEPVCNAEERAHVSEQAMSAMRRCVSRLGDAREAAAVTVEALRAAVEVLTPQGVLSAGVVEHVASRQVLRFRAFIKGGVELSLNEPILARETSMDDPGIVGPWRRIVNESFVWRLTSDERVLHPTYGPWHESEGATAVAYVPLRRGDRVIGFVGFSLSEASAPTRQQRELIESLAAVVSLAIEMQRISDEARDAAAAREQHLAAEQRVAELGKANEAIRLALAALAAEPAIQAIEVMFREIVRAAGADAGYWFRYDAGTRTLTVTLRIDRGTRLTAPAGDEPELFRAPFPADVTPAFDVLCRDTSFVKLSTHVDSDLMWPGTTEWHRRRGRTEALAFAVKVGAEPLGVIGLSFTDRSKMTDVQEHLVRTLSNQFALAVQMNDLAEQAKRAAVDRETARAIAAERSRMAGEIHDSLAQAFTSIALQTEALLSEVGEESPLRESLSVVEETARIGLAEARSSVLALRPVGDKPGDLELALESLANRCSIPGSLACRFRSGPASCPLSADARDAALRVAQEAVANALRHAKATRVDIYYEAVQGWMKLSVRDDGVGIRNVTPPARSGVGISGMRARAAALGGTLTVEAAADGRGTEVRLSTPADARAVMSGVAT